MKGLFKYRYRAFCFLLLIVVAFSASALDIYRTTSELKFRKGPNSKSHSFGVIQNGENVNVIDKSNSEWYKIQYNGNEGYLSSKYLDLVQEEKMAVIVPLQKIESTSSSSVLVWIVIVSILMSICYVIMKKKRQTEEEEDEETLQRIKRNNTTKPNTNTKSANQEFKPGIRVTIMNSNDDSIIDVTGRSYNIIPSTSIKSESIVPFWSHKYVYSYSEINTASQEQKEFYKKFKEEFINGRYLDLGGNNNYAFILMFDLINDYKNHLSIEILELQLDLLGLNYSKTKSYCDSEILKGMELISDTTGLERRKSGNNELTSDIYGYWNLGTQYKKQLDLTSGNEKIANKLPYVNNVFLDIEGCLINTLLFYIDVVLELNKSFVIADLSENKDIEELIKQIKNYYKGNESGYYISGEDDFYSFRSESDIYLTIFKRCENKLRECYNHKRKISAEFPLNNKLGKTFETLIGDRLDLILNNLHSKYSELDEHTEIELNAQNVLRWKIKIEGLILNYNNSTKDFISSIISLGNLNKKNPSIENIFFEASKFIAKHDKESALTLYVYYIFHDLKSDKFDNKQLTKTIQKNLFSSDEQLQEFEEIVNGLVKSKNLNKALEGIPKIYEVKRKKIELNKTSIKAVQQQHAGTVELLNEYLKDDNEVVNNSAISKEINEEVEIKLAPKNEVKQNSIYLDNIAFTQIHRIALELFVKNSFSILQSEFETFAKSKGVFKNQLIDSINELCYEHLDDVLIEEVEEEEFYAINPSYYQRILAK